MSKKSHQEKTHSAVTNAANVEEISASGKLKTKTYEKELRKLHEELVKLQ